MKNKIDYAKLITEQAQHDRAIDVHKLEATDDGIAILECKVLGAKELGKLSWQEVNDFQYFDSKMANDGKGLGKAVAGGLLFGPVGAVVGAITASNKKAHFIYISYTRSGETKELLYETIDRFALPAIKTAEYFKKNHAQSFSL